MKIEKPPLMPHERRVKEMMIGFGQDTPETPEIPDDKTLELRVRLMFEEVLEFAEAAGVIIEADLPEPCAPLSFDQDGGNVTIKRDPNKAPDMTEMVDALADGSVVGVAGTAIALGVRMEPMLELTDANNLMKIANGKVDEHGKFRKHPDHPKPNYSHALALQGWQHPSLSPPSQSFDDVQQQIIDEAAVIQEHSMQAITELQAGPESDSTPKKKKKVHMGFPPVVGQRGGNHLLPYERVYRGPNLEKALHLLMVGKLEEAAKLIEPDNANPESLRPTDSYVPGPRAIIYKTMGVPSDDGAENGDTSPAGQAELPAEGVE